MKKFIAAIATVACALGTAAQDLGHKAGPQTAPIAIVNASVHPVSSPSIAVRAAGLDWDESKAHSAEYDTVKTAELFCAVVNRWNILSGFGTD